jgi:hypothetical protein
VLVLCEREKDSPSLLHPFLASLLCKTGSTHLRRVETGFFFAHFFAVPVIRGNRSPLPLGYRTIICRSQSVSLEGNGGKNLFPPFPRLQTANDKTLSQLLRAEQTTAERERCQPVPPVGRGRSEKSRRLVMSRPFENK